MEVLAAAREERTRDPSSGDSSAENASLSSSDAASHSTRTSSSSESRRVAVRNTPSQHQQWLPMQPPHAHSWPHTFLVCALVDPLARRFRYYFLQPAQAAQASATHADAHDPHLAAMAVSATPISLILQCSLDISEMQGLGKSFAYREFSLIARVGA